MLYLDDEVFIDKFFRGRKMHPSFMRERKVASDSLDNFYSSDILSRV